MNQIVDAIEYEASSFDEWRWMIPLHSAAISLTVFGDWVYEHNNAIHLFSPSAADSFEIATVVDEIDWALENISERAPWVHPDHIANLVAKGVKRIPGNIFHFVTPLFLGGQIGESNVQQLAIPEFFTGMQKLLRQVSM